MYKWSFILLVLLGVLFIAVYAYTHGGRTDANGGHTNNATGVYHFHDEDGNTIDEDGNVIDEDDNPVEMIPPVIPIPVLDFADDIAHEVIRIVDGDTVIIDYEGTETSVRLIGVDTPETVHPRIPEEEYGKEASMFTRNLLQGEHVYLRFDPQNTTDIFGRTLAYLYRAPDGLFVNLEIVRQGYGHAYTDFPFEQEALFVHYGERARLTMKGLWSNDTLPDDMMVDDILREDVNGDGVVNILDLVLVANLIGVN